LPFFLGRIPRAEYGHAFEFGYFDGVAPAAARIFELKELCKMWLMAHVALDGKDWPHAVKRALAVTYIERFFQTWLAELEESWPYG